MPNQSGQSNNFRHIEKIKQQKNDFLKERIQITESKKPKLNIFGTQLVRNKIGSPSNTQTSELIEVTFDDGQNIFFKKGNQYAGGNQRKTSQSLLSNLSAEEESCSPPHILGQRLSAPRIGKAKREPSLVINVSLEQKKDRCDSPLKIKNTTILQELKNDEISLQDLNKSKTPTGPILSPVNRRGVTDVISSLLNSPTFINPGQDEPSRDLGSFENQVETMNDGREMKEEES